MFPLYDTIRTRHFPWMNWMLILANAAVFSFELSLGPAGIQRFIQTWGLVPVHLLTQPQRAWPTLFTSMFIHGGWFHVLSNLWFLAIFGDNIEDWLGKFRYLIFYLLSGLFAALLQVCFTSNSIRPLVGASGAIAGVLGAYLILYPQARVVSFVPLLLVFTIAEIPAVVYLFMWFLLQIVSGLFALDGVGGKDIAWWAHIGGFLFGMIAALVFTRQRTYPQ